MRPDEVSTQLLAEIAVTREDIARAKQRLISCKENRTSSILDEWLIQQKLKISETVPDEDPNCAAYVTSLARSFSLRMSMYMAVWELIAANLLLPVGSPNEWKPSVGYKNSRGGGPIDTPGLAFSYIDNFIRPPTVAGVPTDLDIFLDGVKCSSFHSGILEAVEQSLACFRSGLYLPATVMMAAAAEATWIECGTSLAKKLGDSKLEAVVNDPYVAISKKVVKIRESLNGAQAKPILQAAGQNTVRIAEAEQWTTILRDRRNALHWGKAKSFIVEHSDTASLLLGAPIHLATLEAIRAGC